MESYEKRRRERSEYQKDWYEKHPNYHKKYAEKRRKEHPEYEKKWRKEHPNNCKESQKKWRGKNMDRVIFLNEERRTRKKEAIGNFTFGEWELLKKQYGYCCPSCRKCEPEIKLTIDHIVPLSKGGSNYIENIQPLCRSCNSKKYVKVIKYQNEFEHNSTTRKQ